MKTHPLHMGMLMFLMMLLMVLTGYAEETKKIKIMYYWGDTDTDESAAAMQEILNEEFSQQFPDVELEKDVCDNETYKIKIRILAAADEMPDIVFGYGGGATRIYARQGLFLPVADYLNEFYKDHMIEDMQRDFTFDGVQYGIGFAKWQGVLYYNMELMEKAGAKIPQTLDEFVDVCRKLREADIEPIALGLLNQWQGQQFINNFTIQLCGAEMYRQMALGDISMNNPYLQKAAAYTQRLVEADAFLNDRFLLNSGQAEEKFLNGEAAMIYIGSWFTKSAEERLGDRLAVSAMPSVPEQAYPLDYHGGVSNGWFVSAKTKYPELCCEIAAWLAYRLSCYQPANSTFLMEPEDIKGEISPRQQDIIDIYQDSQSGGSAWDTLMDSERVSFWLDTCSKLFEKRVSPRAFVLLLGSEFG